MPWCCEDEGTVESEQLLQRAANMEPLYVPAVWPWEMMNALAVAVRRQRIGQQQAENFLELLAKFDFRIAHAPDIADMPRLSAMAAGHQLTAYDAAYLDLAQRLDLPLATLDDDLRRAAVAAGVAVL